MGLHLRRGTAIAAALTFATTATWASEDYDLRYAPGVGGADMSAPFEGGWVFQSPVLAYSGHVTARTGLNTDLTPYLLDGVTATTSATVRTQIDVQGLLPRLSYMSQAKFLGAQMGASVLVPIVHKKASVTVSGISTAYSPDVPGAIAAQLGPIFDARTQQLAQENSNERSGLGDMEVSGLLRWSSDATQVMVVGTVVAPTGQYDARRPVNPGAGNFWTFRPSVQYSYIGDGWDIGARVAYSINTRNADTHYKTGNYMNIDVSALKSLSDAWRFGAAGYALGQFSRDDVSEAPTDQAEQARQAVTVNRRAGKLGLGPEVAYIQGAGEFLLEARLIREFAATNAPEGWSAWVNFSKPF